MPTRNTTKSSENAYSSGSVTKTRKATVLPPCRPAAPPAETRRPSEKAPERRCRSGEACPAAEEIGRPEKLARGNGDDFCYRCRSRRADETTRDLETRKRGGAPRTSTG